MRQRPENNENQRHGARVRQSGLTLTELLIAISLAAIVMAASAAIFGDFIKNNRLSAAANDLAGSLSLARTQAINLNQRVVVCKSADGANCSITSDGAWTIGWIVFVDTDNDATVDAGERILRRRPALGNDLTLYGNTKLLKYVSYTPSGANRFINGSVQNGTFTLCDSRAEAGTGHLIRLNNLGRVRVLRGADCSP